MVNLLTFVPAASAAQARARVGPGRIRLWSLAHAGGHPGLTDEPGEPTNAQSDHTRHQVTGRPRALLMRGAHESCNLLRGDFGEAPVGQSSHFSNPHAVSVLRLEIR